MDRGERGRPTAATYDSQAALIVVDVQNDFADPKGSLYVEGGEKVIERVNHEVMAARDASSLIVYTQDWHPPVTPHFAKDGGKWPVHCVADTWGAQIHPEVLVVEASEFVRTGSGGEDGYSAFTVRDPLNGVEQDTGLDERLRSRGVERTVVLGLATDYCVKETALDSARKGFSTTVIGGAVRPVDVEPGDGLRAIGEMRQAGVRVQ